MKRFSYLILSIEQMQWIQLMTILLLLCLTFGLAGAQGTSLPDPIATLLERSPIPVRDMRPYNLLFLQFLPETADTLPLGTSAYRLQLDVANNLLIPSPGYGATVVEDNEVQRLMFSWRRGIDRETELSLFVPILWRDGGFLDGMLSAEHRFFGFYGNGPDNPAGRDALPQYQSLLRILDAQGKPLVDQGNAFGLGEVSLTLKHALLRATPRSALALRLGLKLPTGNPTLLLGSGNADTGLSLDLRYSVGRDINLYLNVGGVLMGHANRVPNPQDAMVQTLFGIEYHPNHRDSFILQADGNSLAVRTGNSFADRFQSTLTFGYRRVLDRHALLWASFSENGDIFNYTQPLLGSIGPDFTVSLGCEWH